MNDLLVAQVRRRANGCCEHCRIPEWASFPPFQIDHIIAQQHGGLTKLSNLAHACYACNKHKGPNVASIDPKTLKLAVLFNPRRHKWARHFLWQGPYLRGRTAIGRATIQVLAINEPFYVLNRRALIEEDRFPPD